MNRLPTRLYTRQQIQLLEKLAIEKADLDEYTLMKNAGLAALVTLIEYWPEARRVVVVCGGGNNAGDGLVVARLAKQHGRDVQVYLLQAAENFQGAALKAYLDARTYGVKISEWDATVNLEADVIIDAILGTGLISEVREDTRSVIDMINAANTEVLAIDVPSGIDVDTGKIFGTAILAAITITYIGIKQGLLTGAAPEYVGRLLVDELKIPQTIFDHVPPSCTRLDYADLTFLLPPRQRTAHKGLFGHVLIIGGDYGYAGAARLAGEACLRTGAGLVTVATRPEHVPIIVSARPELMAHGISMIADLDVLLPKATVIAIGPGLGQSDWSKALLNKVLATDLPLIMDADALNLLPQNSLTRENWILTPHPGEASRLLNTDVRDIQNNRFAAILALQKQYHGVIILKGSGTLISDPEQNISLCTSGNPGMATGGMGDVLTGIIASFVAQGHNHFDAACLATCIHAMAADKTSEQGERGLAALDLMPVLRQLVNP